MTTYALEDTFANVEHADSVLSRIRGLMFKDLPAGSVLVHRWDRVRDRSTHMIGAKRIADCFWLIDGEIVEHERLVPWSGSATHEGDALIQVIGDSPLEVGDRIEF